MLLQLYSSLGLFECTQLSEYSHPPNFREITFRSCCGTIIYLPEHPSFTSLPIATVPNLFRIPDLKFFSALRAFLWATRPHLAPRLDEHTEISVFVEVDLSIDPVVDPYAHEFYDCLHASPPIAHGTAGRFDTVLVRKHPEKKVEFGMESKQSFPSLDIRAHIFNNYRPFDRSLAHHFPLTRHLQIS